MKRRLNVWAEGQRVDQSEGPRSAGRRGGAQREQGCQRQSHTTRLQGARLLGGHCSDPQLLLPDSVSGLPTALGCVPVQG